ncbi:MAG: hypothetical protein GEU81_08670 [Nitriliruptorales bacterium]|nr:hypothetical protein [Nitriliruptorales bacterium]
MRRRTHRRLPRVTLMLAAALLVAACSAPPADDTSGVASIDDATATTDEGTEATAPEDPEDAWAAYEDCMAEEGIEVSIDSAERAIRVHEDESEAESDPQRDPQGPGDFDGEAVVEAEEECGPLLEGVHGDLNLDPEQQARMEDANLAFEACMEEQGIEMGADVPGSPTAAAAAGGRIEVLDEEGAETNPQQQKLDDFDFEAFEEAAKQCDHIWDEVEDLFPDEEAGR